MYQQILSAIKLHVAQMQVYGEIDLNHITHVIQSNGVEKQRLYTKFKARECPFHGFGCMSHVEEWRCMH
jgi:hypothetical protein